MAYRYEDSGEGDQRTIRTRTSIKAAFLEMLSTTEYSCISVSALTEQAGVSRKTFYLHYNGLTALVDEIAGDMARTLGSKFTGDLTGDIYLLYEQLDTDDEAVHRLFTGREFYHFRNVFYEKIFSCGAFAQLAEESRYPELISGYLYSVVGIYEQYIASEPATKDLKRLASTASRLLMSGAIGGGTPLNAYYSFRHTYGVGLRKAA